MSEPLTKEQVDAMTPEQVADQMATPQGRDELSRVMAGKRQITSDMLRDPGALTEDEVAAHWTEIVQASKDAKGTPK